MKKPIVDLKAAMAISAVAPGLGHNVAPAAAQLITEQMARDYAELVNTKNELLATTAKFPTKVANKADLGTFSHAVVAMRDTVNRSKAFHKKEKEPYLRGGQAVDSFFFGLNEELARRMSTLEAAVNAYQQAILAEERRQREIANRKAQAEAEEARLKAERARKAETQAQRTVEANVAERAAEAAQEATQVSSAGLVRTRFEESNTLVTMKQVAFAEVTDYTELPLELLRPYISQSALDSAVKAFARMTDHKTQIPGAKIGFKDDTVIR